MPGVLIISRDWRSRALLRAQLIEEGCDVRAFTSPGEAIELLARPRVKSQRSKVKSQKPKSSSSFLPGLVLADLSLVPDHVEIEGLKALTQNLPAGVPLWIIASRSSADKEWIEMLGGSRLEKVLLKPIDVGGLVREIKGRVQGVDS